MSDDRYPGFGNVPMEPPVDALEFLVRGVCDCGWYCACPEGWQWPTCPHCGKQVRPNRETQGIGYAAEVMPEVAAVRKVRRHERAAGREPYPVSG